MSDLFPETGGNLSPRLKWQEEKRIKGAIEIAIEKTEKKKKTEKSPKKRDPIEPKDDVEYRTVKKKRGKTTVTKPAEGKGKVAKKKGGERKRPYKKRVTQPTTTSPKKKKARRGNCFRVAHQ